MDKKCRITTQASTLEKINVNLIKIWKLYRLFKYFIKTTDNQLFMH